MSLSKLNGVANSATDVQPVKSGDSIAVAKRRHGGYNAEPDQTMAQKALKEIAGMLGCEKLVVTSEAAIHQDDIESDPKTLRNTRTSNAAAFFGVVALIAALGIGVVQGLDLNSMHYLDQVPSGMGTLWSGAAMGTLFAGGIALIAYAIKKRQVVDLTKDDPESNTQNKVLVVLGATALVIGGIFLSGVLGYKGFHYDSPETFFAVSTVGAAGIVGIVALLILGREKDKGDKVIEDLEDTPEITVKE